MFAWKNRGEESDAADETRIDQPQIEALVSAFGKVWKRPPPAEELDALIREHITEEVLYREAEALGLDRNDIVIRRRLRQKMEFLTADVATAGEPDETALTAYFAENAHRYAEAPRLTFTHVYFSREKRGPQLADDVRAGLAALKENADRAAEMGDASLLPAALEAASTRDIDGQFGEAFANALLKLPLGEWQGPVESSYVLHLVRITGREESPPPPVLTKVRDAVRRDYETVQREELNRRTVEELKKRHRITVDEAAVRAAAAASTEETAR